MTKRDSTSVETNLRPAESILKMIKRREVSCYR